MNDVIATIQANIVPIAIMLVVIGIGVNLLKGIFKLAIIVVGCLLIAKLAGVI